MYNTFSNLSTGNRLISLPPPIYSNSYETILDPGTYYFAVQAIDGGLKAGEFSDESSYTLKYEWKLLNQGGIVDRRISGYENPVMKIGDIDNDGDLDLIYGAKSSGNYNDNYTKVFKFDGTRLIGDANNNDYWNGGIQSSSSITDIDIDDINSDGQSDVVINSYKEGSTSNLTAYIADESGNLVQNQIGSGLHNGKVKIIDMNNDGTSEIVLIGLTADNTSGKPKIYFVYLVLSKAIVLFIRILSNPRFLPLSPKRYITITVPLIAILPSLERLLSIIVALVSADFEVYTSYATSI